MEKGKGRFKIARFTYKLYDGKPRAVVACCQKCKVKQPYMVSVLQGAGQRLVTLLTKKQDEVPQFVVGRDGKWRHLYCGQRRVS